MTKTEAYLLVQTAPGLRGVAKALRAVPGVVFALDVRGPFDAVALARPNGPADTLESVLDQIRSIPGVLRALAAPVVHPRAGVSSTERGKRPSRTDRSRRDGVRLADEGRPGIWDLAPAKATAVRMEER